MPSAKAVLPALRTSNSAPGPTSKIHSGDTRASAQTSTAAQGRAAAELPGGRKTLIARQQGLQRITIWVQDGSAWRRARSAGVVDAAGGPIAATPWPVIGTTPSVLINPRAAHHGVGP